VVAVVQEVQMSVFAAAQRDGAFVVDVRELWEYSAGHVPGAALMPLSTVPARWQDLPRDRPVYVICQSGARSAQAAGFLAARGIDARSVHGGTGAWISAGHRTLTGDRAA
jgi:rhodanese-related sulfurtransferase